MNVEIRILCTVGLALISESSTVILNKLFNAAMGNYPMQSFTNHTRRTNDRSIDRQIYVPALILREIHVS